MSVISKLRQKLTGNTSTGLATLFVRVFGAGIGFLSHLLLARLLEPTEYGVYVFAWTIVVLLGTFSGIGLPVAATKFVATYVDQNKTAELGRFSRFSVFVAVFVTGLAVAGILLSLQILPNTLVEAIYRPALFVGAFCVPLFTLTEIGKGLARGLGRNVIAYAPGFLWRPILLGTGVVALYVFGVDLSSGSVMLICLIVLLLALIWQFWYLRGLFVGKSQGKSTPGIRREWLYTAIPLTTMEAYNILLANTDILVLKFFVTPDQLAFYFVATKIAALLSFITFAVSATAGKPIAAAYAKGDNAEVQRLMRQFTALAFWPTLIGFVGLMFVGAYLLVLFGDVYAVAYQPLLILTFGLLAQSYTAVTKFGLAMTGGQRGLSIVLIVSLVCNVLFNLALVPIYGIYGAAFATLATTLFSVIGLLVLTKRRLGFWAVAGRPTLNLAS
ncbi:oligosaccharide flippase family protein [Maritalea porphyrae]|uniref:oligosaccharide flippase family protein n=1 Tax=Maritalea porphyrae TaxID=880732 RepID=UPI0022B05A14|nr:oligosaccharide flippase family protein [Maritalea porphyrae]MCZ4272802.1 oligosaccharide flippase family protein [Maritalea porphyrae]